MSTAEDPTHANAIARQETFVSDRSVRERHMEVHEDASQSAVALVATLDEYPETVEPITDEDRDGFARNAGIAHSFVHAFAGSTADILTPEILDQAFQGWLEAPDKRGYSDEATIAVLGAAFGQHCAASLGMDWVQVVEGSHVSFAVRGNDCDVRAYPYDMIAKRLPNKEVGFFAAVYLVIKNNIAVARLQGDA
jgi:Domain of unknown function (DUF3806)